MRGQTHVHCTYMYVYDYTYTYITNNRIQCNVMHITYAAVVCNQLPRLYNVHVV